MDTNNCNSCGRNTDYEKEYGAPLGGGVIIVLGFVLVLFTVLLIAVVVTPDPSQKSSECSQYTIKQWRDGDVPMYCDTNNTLTK